MVAAGNANGVKDAAVPSARDARVGLGERRRAAVGKRDGTAAWDSFLGLLHGRQQSQLCC